MVLWFLGMREYLALLYNRILLQGFNLPIATLKCMTTFISDIYNLRNIDLMSC